MDDIAARQLAQTLAFKVEAVPQEGASPTRSVGNMTPLNVKIRVRKKDDGKNPLPKGIVFVPKTGQAENLSERLRLASSDHTILSFNMLMETEHERKRKSRRNTFFGNCLGAQTDDDDGPYLPTTDSRSESRFGMIKLKNTTPDEMGTSQALMKKNTNFFGVCKPGGCLDPPFGEDRYAYQPASIKQTARSESISKGVVIVPPIRIEPTEAVKTDTDDRLRNSVIKVDPKELAQKDADDKPENDKDIKGKEVSKAERRLSSDDQDQNNMKIEKLRKTASSNRPQSNEFSTLFFSPPRREKNSSKDSGSGRRDSRLEQRRNTPEPVKLKIPLSRKDDNDKQISSAPILILSDTETGDTPDQNRSPETLQYRPHDQRKILITPRGEEPADVPKGAASTLPFSTDAKNKEKGHDNKQMSKQQEHIPEKHIPKDIANVAKQRRNMPSAQLSDILSSDVTESQQDDIIESGKGSLVMSPITEIIIPPVGKIIKHSQTDDLVKRKPESFSETRKHSSSQLTKSDIADPSKTTKDSILKEPVKIEKLRGPGTANANLHDNNMALPPKHERETQQTDAPRISTKLSAPTVLVDITKQPIPISKQKSDIEQELKQNPVRISDHDLIEGEIQIPVTKIIDVNQFQSKEDKNISEQMKIVNHATPDNLLKDKDRPSISPNRTDTSVKTKNEDTQLHPDPPKKDILVLAQNRDSNASVYFSDNKKVADGEIKLQPHKLPTEEFKDSSQVLEYQKKRDQNIISKDVKKIKHTPVKQSEPYQPTIDQDSPIANYQKIDDNQKYDPSTMQDIEITQAYDKNKQQLYEPKEGKGLERKSPGVLDDSQVSTNGANRDDPQYINLVFQKYTYDNKRGIKTLDADSKFELDENIVTYKSNSQVQDKKITIPIDGQNVVAIKIKKSSSTGENDEKELLALRSNIHKYSDSSKGENEKSPKNYTGGSDAGFELPPDKRKSVTEGRHNSKSETGAKIYSPKRSSIENRKASVSTRNTAESKLPSSTFKDDKPKTFEGNDLEISTKMSKRDSEYSNSRGPSNKRGSFTPERVDLLGDRSNTGIKATSPRQSVFNGERRISASTEAAMSPYERSSVKSVTIVDANAKRSTLLSDSGPRTYSQNHILRDDRADSKGEFFSNIPSSNIADIDINNELYDNTSRRQSTTSGRHSLGRSGIDTRDDPHDFFDDPSYDINIKYTNRTDTETNIPTFYDGTIPAKRISSLVSRNDSNLQTPISSFRQTSLTGNKTVPLDDRSEVNKRSFSNYGENRSGSTHGRKESGTRVRSSKGTTFNEAKSDYTDDIGDDKIIKYDSFFDRRKVDSYSDDKSGRTSGAFYPFEDDKAGYSKADKTIHRAAHSHTRSVDREDTYINKKISYEEDDKRGKGKTYLRYTDVNTDFQFSKKGSRGKLVKYSDEDDSRIAVIGREINRTLSFIYEHELIPLQHVIKGLKEDIDVLAEQQVLLREKLHGPKRVRPVRKCGCYKRYDFGSILE